MDQALRAWKINDPLIRQRFRLTVVLFPIFSFPFYQAINPDRGSVIFRLNALFDVNRWLNVELWGVISFGLLFSLWAASAGMGALIAALNSAYDVEEGRPFWKAQLVALGLIIALCFLVIGGAVLITFGDPLALALANLIGYQKAIGTIWLVIRYLMGLAMLIIGMAVIYIFAPNVRQRWTWIVPGALFAVATFVSASYVFSLYIRYAPSYNATYGSLGAVIVLMLWLYLLGLIMYIGGEINSQIASAAGKRAVALGEQSVCAGQSASRGGVAGRRAGASGVRPEDAAAGTLGAAPRGRFVSRLVSGQRPHDGQRCAVGRAAGADPGGLVRRLVRIHHAVHGGVERERAEDLAQAGRPVEGAGVREE